jgi:hypothetical protein
VQALPQADAEREGVGLCADGLAAHLLAKASPYFLAHGATGRVAVGGSYGYRLTFDTIAMETPNKAPHGWIVALDQ